METNEILYANKALTHDCGGLPLTGRICWEALQNETGRCKFCPIPYLLKHPGKNYKREIYNGVYLVVHDSIIPWNDGKLVHLQYVVEISSEYSAWRE